jgi:hypothetical protein
VIFNAKIGTIKNIMLVNNVVCSLKTNFPKHLNKLCQISVLREINIEQHFKIKGFFIKWTIFHLILGEMI